MDVQVQAEAAGGGHHSTKERNATGETIDGKQMDGSTTAACQT
jgi:hypothetical protein